MNLVLIKTYMEQEIFAIFETYFFKISVQSGKKVISTISHRNFILL